MDKMLKYFEDGVLFAAKHIEIILLAGFALVAAFLLLNLFVNPYVKHNRRAKRATKLMARSLQLRKSVPVGRLRLPDEYFDGFQNYRSSQSRFPSEFMTFQPKKQFILGQLISWLYVVASGALLIIHTLVTNVENSFVATQIMIFVSVIIGLIVANVIVNFSYGMKTRRAKKLFKRFARHLDISFGERYFSQEGAVKAEETCLDRDIDDTVAKIEFLKSSGINAATAREVAALLSNEKLNKPRTHEQQRKLNTALNGLLQTLSTASQKQTTGGIPS